MLGITLHVQGRFAEAGGFVWSRVASTCSIHCGVEVTELSTNKQHSLSPNSTAAAAAAAEEEEVCMFQCSELHDIFKDALQKLEDLFGPELPAHVVSTVV